MDIGDLVAVHLTRYLPIDNSIETLNSIFPDQTLHNTIHFSLNHPVITHGFSGFTGGNWDDTKYVVIASLEGLCKVPENEIKNFNVVDTYFVGDVKLPEGSTVIVSSHAYEDLIEQGIVDRDKLMSKFGDERCPPQPDDKLVIEKDGIKYIILSWNSETSLREEAYKEIAAQGYRCMPGGQWNWGMFAGASQEDQERVANKIGAETLAHNNDELKGLEQSSHHLSNIASGDLRSFVEDYLERTNNGGRDFNPIDDIGSNANYGEELLRKAKFLMRSIEISKRKLSPNFQRRIDAFLSAQKEGLRAFIPPAVAEQFQLSI